MVGLIICTHGKFSEELVRTSEMMFGKQENVLYLTFETGENTDGLVDKYIEALRGMGNVEEILFMVDLFGGSPYNAACRIAATKENMDVVTGVNLPMLLEVYGTRSFLKVEDLVKTAIQAASQGMKSFKEVFNNSIGEDL